LNNKILTLLLVLMMVGPGFGQSGASKTAVAVWDFEAINLPSGDVDVLTRRITSLLVATDRYVVTDRNVVQAILAEQSFQASGCVSGECIVEIGQLLGVQKVVTGSFGRIGNIYTTEMKIIDIQSGMIERTANYDLEGDIGLLLKVGIVRAMDDLLQLNSEGKGSGLASAERPVSAFTQGEGSGAATGAGQSRQGEAPETGPYVSTGDRNENAKASAGQSSDERRAAASAVKEFGGVTKSGLYAGFDLNVLVGRYRMVDGGIVSVTGITPMLGIGHKRYFSPLKKNSVSLYWTAGTDMFVLPYGGLGLDLRAGETFFLGASVSSRLIALMIPLPTVAAGFYF